MHDDHAQGCATFGLALVALAITVPIADAHRRGHHHKSKTVNLQLLGINDFHGNLEPPGRPRASGRVGTIPAGGAEYLATHVAQLRAPATRNTSWSPPATSSAPAR